ncbi:hypothetical protein B0H13DRAFT_2657094, partial [Mycena leptocephala]
MSLVSLPVELVSKILTGMSIADLLSVTRTSHYPRAVCLTERQIWRLALDCDMLPLPAGKTLDSIELPLLLCCAARAISIAKALQGPTIIPLKSVELTGLYNVQAWGMWLHEVPSRCHILPGGHSFLMGGTWLGLYDIRGTYAHKFNHNNLRPVTWASESRDNGDSVIVAVVWTDEDRHESSLCVYTLQYDPDSGYSNPPVISLFYTTQTPYLTRSVEMCMKDLLILIWNTPWHGSNEELLLLDLNHQKRARAKISANSIVHACLHPRLPLVVALVAGDRGEDGVQFTLEFVDIELQPTTSGNNWET